MADEKLRDLERRYRETGNVEDGWRWCQEITRAGQGLDAVGLATRLYRLERMPHTALTNGAIAPSSRLDQVQDEFARDPLPEEVAAYLRGVSVAGSLADPPPPDASPCRHGVVPPSDGHGGEHCTRCARVDEAPPYRMVALRVVWDDLPPWVTQHYSWTMEGSPPDLTFPPDLTYSEDEIEAWIIDKMMPHSTRMLGTVIDHVWDTERRLLDLLVLLATERADTYLSMQSFSGRVVMHHNGNTAWPRLGRVDVTLHPETLTDPARDPDDDPAQSGLIA